MEKITAALRGLSYLIPFTPSMHRELKPIPTHLETSTQLETGTLQDGSMLDKLVLVYLIASVLITLYLIEAQIKKVENKGRGVNV
jgi:hypothetical protein